MKAILAHIGRNPHDAGVLGVILLASIMVVLVISILQHDAPKNRKRSDSK